MMLSGIAFADPVPVSGYSPLHLSVNRHMYLATTYLPKAPQFTTEMATIVDDVDRDLDYLKKKLPWLSSVLNSNNTITLSSGMISTINIIIS